MLVPLSWLKKYVPITISTSDLVAKLNASGTSVEHALTIGQGLDDLVVGLVEDVYPHPKADRLRLAKINDGHQTVEVVCGAPNLATGQKIVFARPGSKVPIDMHDPERKPFVLETATIRGVVSNGMICSTAEMGLGQDHDGILVLDQNLTPGTPINQALGYPQTILDVEITTNRADELSIIGIAREVATLTGQPLTIPTPAKPSLASSATQVFEPTITTPDCYRLITQVLTVTIGPSPDWLKQALELTGMRSINNVVDITNYVMQEYGQPLHAYDAAKLAGNTLQVRFAQDQESIVTLDGKHRQLQPEMMVIADQDKALGIAGIMGGQDSGTTDTTTTIVLEAAVFDPVSIRKTAKTLALRSEASRRYERSVDREMTDQALDRAVELLVAHAQATPAGPKRQAYPHPYQARQLNLSSSKLFQYLGQSIDPLQVRDILKSLGFGDASAFGKDDDWHIAVWVPSWRMHDIQGQEDLIEEVARILGYDNLPASLPAGQLTGQPLSAAWTNQYQLKLLLARLGWTETMAISLVGSDLYAKVQLPLPPVAITNPLSSDWTHMRDQLLPQLIQTTAANQRRSQHTLALFELSNTYHATNDLPAQHLHLSLSLLVNDQPEQAVARLKYALQSALAYLGQAITFSPAATPQPYLNANALAITLNQDHAIGQLGLVSAPTQQAFGLEGYVLVAEVDLSSIIATINHPQFSPLAKFPSIEEDLSLLVNATEPLGPIIDAIYQAGQPLLSSVNLTSVYTHPSLGPDKKSPFIHLTFRHPDHSLSSQDIASARQAIADKLLSLGVSLRQ